MSERTVVAVVGPTATGKSDLGVDLALALGAAEVVNADAYQLYRGMDVGTAKLTAPERRGVPHHQLDVLDPAQDASVAVYQREARADLAALDARGCRAIVVGGSGLYVRSLLDRMDFPPTDAGVRARIEARAESEGPRPLHDELTRLDPVAAAGILPGNTKRIVRALEVIEITGGLFSSHLPVAEHLRPTVQIGLDSPRDELDARVEARVERMWEQGLLDEVRALDAAGMGRTARRAVGYAEALEHLAGRLTAAEAREATAAATRRLTRKQMGWFGRDARTVWLPAGAPDLLERALDVVARADAGTLDVPRTGEPTRRSLGS
ncbi:tRNA (adenosine(37)-N6)-dimethylallyltransferase MiaA [Sanguibacter sp. HDW7]|uniref:tRNA (adenosine(37)-N6)-dimethylallyltransferase MiaA n=1 Tax=Sanguibacter sp. HDW7 TaxID=2714931 RepID=UPI00140C5E75|nr:tRNA (adenosine(37)-N6)-dimethylallyltransferase MiaA [Sanguibacter sp. HDW7]QIK83288.1 tRNA (adenosine(37)-N6)-dimethylallyltransferase MiaA [Sanguibacter sp. HDW7]